MRRVLLVVALLFVTGQEPAGARTQPDPLGTCLADNSTGRDRKDLATWVFLAMAAHPDLETLAPPDLEASTTQSAKVVGALVTRLLTESCVAEAGAAARAGQSNAFVQAFQRLGEVAMQELMTDKAVTGSVGRFEQFLDHERLRKAFGQH